jgi:tetratricopeptide (TPR) repeat protein
MERFFTEFEKLGNKFYMAFCMLVIGNILHNKGNHDLTEKHYQKAIILSEEIGDRDVTPFIWALMGHTAYKNGDTEKAKTYALEAINILEVVEDDLLASALMSYELLGDLTWRMGEYQQAEKHYQNAISKAKSQRLYLSCEIKLCLIAMSQGDYHKAGSLLKEIYQSIKGRGFGLGYMMVIRVLAELAWCVGNYPQVEKWLTELQELDVTSNQTDEIFHFHKPSIALGRAKVALSKKNWSAAAEHTIIGLKIQIQMPIYYFTDLYEDKFAAVYLTAIIVLAQELAIKAARLLGSTSQSYQANKLTFPLFRRQLIDQTIEETRTALDEESFTSAWEQGRAMDLNEALVYALEVMEEVQQANS